MQELCRFGHLRRSLRKMGIYEHNRGRNRCKEGGHLRFQSYKKIVYKLRWTGHLRTRLITKLNARDAAARPSANTTSKEATARAAAARPSASIHGEEEGGGSAFCHYMRIKYSCNECAAQASSTSCCQKQMRGVAGRASRRSVPSEVMQAMVAPHTFVRGYLRAHGG